MDTEESQVPNQPAPQQQGLLRAQSTKKMLSKRTSQGRDSVFFTCQFFTKACVLRKPRSRKSIAGRGRHSDSARNRKLWIVRSTLLIKWFIYGNILYSNMIQTCQKDQEPMYQFQEWMLENISATIFLSYLQMRTSAEKLYICPWLKLRGGTWTPGSDN